MITITIQIDDRKIPVEVTDEALDHVLAHFNPSESTDVTVLKALSAGFIAIMLEISNRFGSTVAQRRAAAIAITQMELTQMAGVKAMFARAPSGRLHAPVAPVPTDQEGR